MRLAVTVVATAVLSGLVGAQLSLGPHGMSTPSINLLQMFRIARETVGHLYDNFFDQSEAKEINSVIDEKSDKIDYVTDKAKTNCHHGDKCWSWLQGFTELLAEYEDVTPTEVTTDDPTDPYTVGKWVDYGNYETSTDSPTFLDMIESKYIVVKWVMAYVGIIITCSVLIVTISVPYLITGQTFRSLDNGLVPPVDHKDSLILLTWLLGEASGDVSCLERVVCLNPERSARYLAIPNVVGSYLYSFVPVRYQKQIKRLEEVTDNGLHYSCQQYSCPVLPEL